MRRLLSWACFAWMTACFSKFISSLFMTKTLFTLYSLLWLGWCGRIQAQCSTMSCDVPVVAFSAPDACILPEPQAMNCYFGSTQQSTPLSFPPAWCGSVENNQWFAFTATASTASFDITTTACSDGPGIQVAILSTSDCVNFSYVSPCVGLIEIGQTTTVTATSLIPGHIYYLMIDGFQGALCDFSINAMPYIPSNGTNTYCLPSPPITFNSNVFATWSISPPGAGVFVGPSTGTQVTVNWLQPGVAELCAQGQQCNLSNCLEITIGHKVSVAEAVNLCPGGTAECAGQSFSAPGNYPVHFSVEGCDSTVNCLVHLLPVIPSTTEHAYYCPGYTTTCAGETFSATGAYTVHLASYNGCDSVVNCLVHIIPAPMPATTQVEICAPGIYHSCQGEYDTTGLYQYTCPAASWQGCDSLVKLDLAVFNPVPDIAFDGLLSCGTNGSITLYGNNSSINPAPGGHTYYHWTGPGIVGANDQISIQVNQPGQYCLQLTHERNGHACSRDTCIVVPAPITSQAGLMDSLDRMVCGPNPAVPLYLGGEVLLPGDTLAFLLYSDSLHPLSSIIAYSDTLNFPFLPGLTQFDTVYFIAAIAGNELPNDSIDLHSPCLGLSLPVRLVWRKRPTVEVLPADQSVCKAGCLAETFQFDGSPPFVFTWQVLQSGQVLLSQDETSAGFEKTVLVCPSDFTPSVSGAVEFRILNLKDRFCGCAD